MEDHVRKINEVGGKIEDRPASDPICIEAMQALAKLTHAVSMDSITINRFSPHIQLNEKRVLVSRANFCDSLVIFYMARIGINSEK